MIWLGPGLPLWPVDDLWWLDYNSVNYCFCACVRTLRMWDCTHILKQKLLFFIVFISKYSTVPVQCLGWQEHQGFTCSVILFLTNSPILMSMTFRSFSSCWLDRIFLTTLSRSSWSSTQRQKKKQLISFAWLFFFQPQTSCASLHPANRWTQHSKLCVRLESKKGHKLCT